MKMQAPTLSTNKRSEKKLLALVPLFLTLFFAVNNFAWLKLNQLPPVDDEAFHLDESLQFMQILSHPSWDIVARLSKVMAMQYPPIFPFGAALWGFLFGNSILSLCMFNILFVAGIFFCLYLIGCNFGNPRAGALAAFLLAFYPMFFRMSRMFMLETALCFTVLLTLLLLLRTEGFRGRRESFWAGVSLGLGLLTKTPYIIFVGGAVVWTFLGSFLKESPSMRKRIRINAMIFLAVGAFIAVPWYAMNFKNKLAAFHWSALNQLAVNKEMSVLSWQSLFYYIDLLLSEQTYLFFTGIFIVAIIILRKSVLRETRYYNFLCVWILVPYAILTLFPVKFYYYTLPYLPAIALFSAFGILEVKKRLLRKGFLFLIIAVGVFQFFDLSYLNYAEEYPVLRTCMYAPRRGDFQIDELFRDMSKSFRGGRLRLGAYTFDGNEIERQDLAVGDHFVLANPATLKIYAKWKNIPCEIVDMRYGPEAEAKNQVDFIVSLTKLEDADIPYLRKQNFTLLNDYVMPDGSLGYLYRSKSSPRVIAPAQPKILQEIKGHLNGRLDVVLSGSAWKVLWKGNEITKGLSVYTSYRSFGQWYDSMQCRWEMRKVSEEEFLAVGWNNPVLQTWHFKREGDRISWKVTMRVDAMLKLEREQANIMLSSDYKKWEASDGDGAFPAAFNRDYHGDWQALHIMDPRPDKAVSVTGDGAGLPSVSFYCTHPRNGMKGIVINSDDQFEGRVLQYSVKHGPFYYVRPGEYEYFSGYFLIRE